MIDIVPEKARKFFDIPEGFDPFVALAIGYRGGQTGHTEYQQRDTRPRVRRPLHEFVFSQSWNEPLSVVTD